ncbi:hypothetical protein QJQ45_014622, partial [Haematococcus lacustris]
APCCHDCSRVPGSKKHLHLMEIVQRKEKPQLLVPLKLLREQASKRSHADIGPIAYPAVCIILCYACIPCIRMPCMPCTCIPNPLPHHTAALVQVKQEMILDDQSLHDIWQLLEEFSKQDGDQLKINYDGFSQVANKAREMFGAMVDPCFKPSLFARFAQDSDGYISATLFAAHLSMRAHMQALRIQLSSFDEGDTGCLKEQQLGEFLRSQAMELELLEDMQPSFLQHYCNIAARKIMFFHGKNGSVKIKELLTSPLMKELLDLREPDPCDPRDLLANWFSLQSTTRVHDTFLALDQDMNGMLSRSEFSEISNRTMSPLFIQRIFEEHVMQRRNIMHRSSTHRDEMDLTAFADFVLAWDHRSHPAAIKYFFPVLDLKNQGFVTPAEIYTFFKEIHVMWVNMGEYADLAIYDVVDEILDMVKPKTATLITPEDLEVSGMSGIFFSMLADVKLFHNYNYRENFIHQDES